MRAPILAVLWVIVPALATAGDVVGLVRHRGPEPAVAQLAVTKDRATCGESARDESLLVSGGGLENVVVRVVVPGARAEPRRAQLDQQRCRFSPHVQAVPVGSTLEILNGDPILHGVHGYAGIATAFNAPLASQGQRRSETLRRAGPIQVTCDVHGWMSAWIVVVDGPHFAVSDAAGRFAIPGVPPGRWAAIAWHERLGERTAMVEVPASGTATLELAYP